MASSNNSEFGNFSGRPRSSVASPTVGGPQAHGTQAPVEGDRKAESRKDLEGLGSLIERLQVQRLSEEGVLPGGKSIPAFLPRVEPLKPVDIEW